MFKQITQVLLLLNVMSLKIFGCFDCAEKDAVVEPSSNRVKKRPVVNSPKVVHEPKALSKHDPARIAREAMEEFYSEQQHNRPMLPHQVASFEAQTDIPQRYGIMSHLNILDYLDSQTHDESVRLFNRQISLWSLPEILKEYVSRPEQALYPMRYILDKVPSADNLDAYIQKNSMGGQEKTAWFKTVENIKDLIENLKYQWSKRPFDDRTERLYIELDFIIQHCNEILDRVQGRVHKRSENKEKSEELIRNPFASLGSSRRSTKVVTFQNDKPN